MSEEICFVAPTPDRAKEVVAQIKQIGIKTKSISVVDQSSAAEIHTQSQEFRNAVNGSIVGAIIGLFYGAATLTVIGAAFIPSFLGASLILGYSAFGGVLFGALIGSTGIFARSRFPVPSEQPRREEGNVLISVELFNPEERDRFLSAVNAWGVSDIHYSGKPAA